MLPTTPQWTSIVKSKKYTSRQKKFSSLVSLVSIIKKDPTNRIRTSDLRKSIYYYSPPLYQLSYGRYPKKDLCYVCKVNNKRNKKKLHRRESNPGHKRERLVCYQLHHNGFLLLPFSLPFLSVLLYPCFISLEKKTGSDQPDSNQ